MCVPDVGAEGEEQSLNLKITPYGQLIGESGQPYSILEEKNAARLPAYYRIDASATYHFVLSPFRGSVGASFANLTDRKNILSYDRKTGQRINMLDFFPSATLKMEF